MRLRNASRCRFPTSRGYVPSPADEKLAAQFQRQVVFYRSSEAPGRWLISYLRKISLRRAAQRTRSALRHRRWPRWVSVAGPATDHPQTGMAGLDAAAGNDSAPALSPALHGRRPGQPHGCACTISAPRCTAFTAPISRKQSAAPCRRDASASSTAMWTRGLFNRVPVGDQGHCPAEAGAVNWPFGGR